MPPCRHEEIKNYLIERDRKLRPLVAQLAFPVTKRNRDVYATLVHSIIAQQLSIKAANTIHSRLLALFPDAYPDPVLLRKMPLERLRGAGLSRQKSSYLKEIAGFALEQGLDYAMLARFTDDQIIAYLTQIHGVGRWTVEMLLMFCLNRADVFAVDDVGIQNVMRHLYDLDQTGRSLKQSMRDIAENWRPYRSIVCKYLWHWKAVSFGQPQ